MNVVNKEKLLGTTNIVGWNIGESLHDTRIKASCITTRNHVYLLGGVINNEFSNRVDVAVLKSTGVVSDWQPAEPFPISVASAISIKVGSSVYVLGGWNGNSISNVIYRSIIDESGRLGDWNKVGTLPVYVSDAEVFVLGEQLYIVGGLTTTESTGTESLSDKIYTCPIIKDDGLGEWTEYIVKLPKATSGFVLVPTSKRIYIVGGGDAVGPTDAVYYSEVTDNKQLSEFLPDKELPSVTETPLSVVAGNRVILLGGTDDRKNLVKVYMANIGEEGNIEEWRECDELPLKASACNVFVDNTSINILGAGDGADTLFAMFDGWKEKV